MNPLRLSLSSPTLVRWKGITVELNGQPADPRSTYTVQFQLVVPADGEEVFGPWAPGAWDAYPATPLGPFSATVVIGPGQPTPVNPGVEGTYLLYGRPVSAAESPPFYLRPVILDTP